MTLFFRFVLKENNSKKMPMRSGFIKIIIAITYSLLLNSCNQNQSKEKTNNKPIKDSLTIVTSQIDSSLSQNYSVDIDTAYIYARPDLTAKTRNYLTKNEWIEIQKKEGEFGFAVQLNDSIKTKGWLRLKDLKQIFFTPPRIVNE